MMDGQAEKPTAVPEAFAGTGCAVAAEVALRVTLPCR
jgi:hypothetical protein